MNVERPELRLVREKLESVLAPALAQSALFEALAEAGGRPPTSRDAVVALIEGPLCKALSRRLDAEDLDALVKEIVETVERVFAAAPPLAKGRPRELEITLEITRGKGAVGVLVFSGSDDLAARLEVALGPDRVAARTCTNRNEVESLLRGNVPPILLVDSVDFPPIEPVELAELLASAPRGTVRAIWGADLGYGSVVLGELVERRAPATPLDRREGIDPLLDLVRSRGSA
jgi:hypothetical protein